jgi:hypothetical protein
MMGPGRSGQRQAWQVPATGAAAAIGAALRSAFPVDPVPAEMLARLRAIDIKGEQP